MGSCSFPSDALVSPQSHCQFGFMRDFLQDTGTHFKMRVTTFWDSSLHVGFLSSCHQPSTFLPVCVVIHTDEWPPLAPVLEASSAIASAMPAVDGDGLSPQCLIFVMPSADHSPHTILHCSPHSVRYCAALQSDSCLMDASICVSGGMDQHSGDGALGGSGGSGIANNACAHPDHDGPTWDSHTRDDFCASRTFDQLLEACECLLYASGASWTF